MSDEQPKDLLAEHLKEQLEIKRKADELKNFIPPKYIPATPKAEFMSAEPSLSISQQEPLCRFYEEHLAAIITALKASASGEVTIAAEPFNLKPTTLRLNLREARNGFKSGVKSEKIPADFNLSRLEFSLAMGRKPGVTIRDSQRYVKAKPHVEATSLVIKSDYDIGVIGAFPYSDKAAQLLLDLQQLCYDSGDASLYGYVKFKCETAEQHAALRKMFSQTSNIKVDEAGLVEVPTPFNAGPPPNFV